MMIMLVADKFHRSRRVSEVRLGWLVGLADTFILVQDTGAAGTAGTQHWNHEIMKRTGPAQIILSCAC